MAEYERVEQNGARLRAPALSTRAASTLPTATSAFLSERAHWRIASSIAIPAEFARSEWNLMIDFSRSPAF